MADSIPTERLERDLEAARHRGRWLSDEEQQALDRESLQRQLSAEQRQSRRNRLVVLAAVCALLPPLWPLAFGLTLYLLFPRTVASIGMVMGAVLLVGGLTATVVLAMLTIGLFQLLF